MTPRERMCAAVAVSLACHYALIAGWPEAAHPPAADAPISVALTGAEAGISLAPPIALEQALATEPAADAPEGRRRAALEAYLDAIAEAVHARRGLGGGRMIGNVPVAITIDAAGRFIRIVAAGSSGDPALDADALTAVRAASGAVPRPPRLGAEPLAATLTVKYQFGL